MTLVAHRVAKVGGMERAFAELAEGLLARGYEVRVISRECDLSAHPNLRKVSLYSPNRPFLLAYPLFLVRGSLAIRRHRRGLVHVLGAIVLNSADVATVQFCHHGFDTADALARSRSQSRFSRFNALAAHLLSIMAERFVYGGARVRWLIPAANGVAREVTAHFPGFRGKQTIIPNGVDRASFKPAPDAAAKVRASLAVGEDELLCAFVGGDWERKGLRFAIEALARSPGWRLMVVGDGPVGRYAALTHELGVETRVDFVGHQRETSAYFSAADAFVLPTAYEAFPLVMLEAAASGVPVLVTRTNGAEEFIDEGINGYFIERDGVQIASRLHRLAEIGSAGRQAMGAACRAATERYSWPTIVDAHVALYEQLADTR